MSTNRSIDGGRVRALRGATSVSGNDEGAIVSATAELLRELLARNGATTEDLVSILFTSTPDLTAAFPAAAARALGLEGVPLLCATEIPVAGALGRCVRVLVHLYTDRGRDGLEHVYLGEASRLRAAPDEA
jgi:chorismate mutase